MMFIETAKIKSVLESVANLADLNNFDALENLFAANVKIDYTNLWGGEPQYFTPQNLMCAWAEVLSGFNATKHDLRNIQIKVNGKEASATAEVTANHWLGTQHWLVRGVYHYQLQQVEQHRWCVSHLTFTVVEEQGNRDLIAQAQQQAAINPPAYLRRVRNQMSARNFLDLLTAKNMPAFFKLWADNGIQDMPFSPQGFPKKIVGMDALVKHWSGVPDAVGRMEFSDIEITLVTDPNQVIMKYRGEVEILATGKLYANDYLSVISFDDAGKISCFLEYYDPIRFQQAWGPALTESFALEKQ